LETTVNFNELGLSEPLLRALTAEGYTVPTPIQEKAIPHVLAGSDLLGVAQTGTGKTAAFALPILDRLGKKSSDATPQGEPARARETAGGHGHGEARQPAQGFRGRHGETRPGHAPQRSHSSPPRDSGRRIRALILAPTRELAAQIGESFAAYGRHMHLRHAVIFGGVNQNPQTRALRDGVDILVATPGRLLDLMNQGYVNLGAVEVFVLDEADRMLDMGFIHDIRKIAAKLPHAAHPQTLLFSATMPSDIRQLAATLLRNPVSVQVAAESTTAERIDQSVYFVEKRHKPVLLTHLLETTSLTRALVFTRTKHGADRVAKHLHQRGIDAAAIHGNKSQSQRQRALEGFRSGKVAVLIASDIAARGIDIDEISHVFNYDLPNVPETYVHRIGRTARAGAAGIAIAFCDHEEKPFLKSIERLTRVNIPVRSDHPPYPKQEHEAPRQQPSHRPSHPRPTHAPTHSTHAPRPPHAAQASHAPHPSSGAAMQRPPVKPSPGGHHPSGGMGAGPRKTEHAPAQPSGSSGGGRRRRRW
jgi:ATP-dependent RNA helicase RhlE